MGMAFGITEDDVSTVLQKNWSRLVRAESSNEVKSADSVAEDLIEEIDHDAVERAALKGGVEMDEQTDAAHDEIERQLVEKGFLKPLITARPPGP